MSKQRSRVGWGRLGAFGIAFVFASGCVASTGGAGGESTSLASAPSPTTAIDSGSISGRLVDEELRPVAGATAAIVETAAETTTDAEGRFTFNDVPPGSYRLIVSRLGYEDVARKVEVRAGEVTTVEATMKAIVVGAEAYHVTFPKTALIHFDAYLVSYYRYSLHVNQSTLNSLRCDPCVFVLHIQKDPKAVLTEARWPPSGNQVVNPSMDTFYDKDWTPDTRGAYVCSFWHTSNPSHRPWSETCVKNAKGKDKLKLEILGADLGVSFEHRIDTWTTFGYNDDLPDEFTAFPPP